ncbi:hypothetical protein MKEN_01159200 [Mycena kentingensis (nom. inval.)]|nr:hypothetical protein MKEN_01159200 [Mycena kentingensis (nom. inval.)]
MAPRLPPVPGLEDVSMSSSQAAVEVNISQETVHISQESPPDRDPAADADCWGMLVPSNTSPADPRVRLLRTQTTFTIGRGVDNTLVLPSKQISRSHASISWNGMDGNASEIMITDLSFNGTWIGDNKIGKGLRRLLTDGDQIVFGPKNLRVVRESDPAPSVYRFRNLISVPRAISKYYDLHAAIGQGTYAQVYKALDRRPGGKWVAVKSLSFVKLIAASSKGPLGRMNEVNVLRKLKDLAHTNMVKLIEHFENADQSIDIVMELLAGGDLDRYILTYDGGAFFSSICSDFAKRNGWHAAVFMHSQDISCLMLRGCAIAFVFVEAARTPSFCTIILLQQLRKRRLASAARPPPYSQSVLNTSPRADSAAQDALEPLRNPKPVFVPPAPALAREPESPPLHPQIREPSAPALPRCTTGLLQHLRTRDDSSAARSLSVYRFQPAEQLASERVDHCALAREPALSCPRASSAHLHHRLSCPAIVCTSPPSVPLRYRLPSSAIAKSRVGNAYGLAVWILLPGMAVLLVLPRVASSSQRSERGSERGSIVVRGRRRRSSSIFFSTILDGGRGGGTHPA